MKLLPHIFKYIGFGVAVAALLFSFIYKEFFASNQLNLQVLGLWKPGVVLGLAIAAFAREKEEDELVRDIRYRTMALVFAFPVIAVLLHELRFWFNIQTEEQQELAGTVLSMLTAYHFFFYLNRKQMFGKENSNENE